MSCFFVMKFKLGFVFLYLLLPAVFSEVCYVSPTGNASETNCRNINNPCLGFKTAVESATPQCNEILAFGGVYTGNQNTQITGHFPLVIDRYNGTVEIDMQQTKNFMTIITPSANITNFTFIMSNMEMRNGLGNALGGTAFLLAMGPITTFITPVLPITFENMYIHSMRAVAQAPGGGSIYLINFPITIRNSTFRNNSIHCNSDAAISCNGGAIQLLQTVAAEFTLNHTIEDSLFEENFVFSIQNNSLAAARGGALYIASGSTNNYTSNVVIRRSSFKNNHVTTAVQSAESTIGGALAATNANISIECTQAGAELCIFSGNRVFSAATTGERTKVVGGAIEMPSGAVLNEAQISMRNVIFYNNSVSCNSPSCAAEFGGGALAASRISISGCRFCNNSAEGGNGAHILVLNGTDTEELNAGPAKNIFTCNNTGPAIEPLQFTCSSPECVYPTPVVDPTTGICEACILLAITATPTRKFHHLFIFAQLHM